jgi:hypothetical protein
VTVPSEPRPLVTQRAQALRDPANNVQHYGGGDSASLCTSLRKLRDHSLVLLPVFDIPRVGPSWWSNRLPNPRSDASVTEVVGTTRYRLDEIDHIL